MTQIQEQNETTAVATAEANQVNVFAELLTKPLRNNSERKTQRQKEIDGALGTMAQWVLRDEELIKDDVFQTIQAIITGIDTMLSQQLNAIIHHEDFQQLEGTWRGLHHLVNNTETDETLKIRVINLPKKDLAKSLKKYRGTAWDQNPIFKKIYEKEFGSPGGEPYGCLVGDYYFNHETPDVDMLNGIAQIAAAAHAPFISAADPSVMDMESWQQLNDKRDLTKIFQTADYAPWRSLRESEDARYLGLTMPRCLARVPYGARTNPVEEFAFEEDTDGTDHGKYLWTNAAYAMATNINRAFKLHGWCASIRGTESGGKVEGLPCHTFPTDDGGVDMKCPTEVAVTDRLEAELAKNGFIPLSHYKNTDYAVFFGAESLQKTAKYDDADATANTKLAARLPYVFATCRFAHYLKCIVRDMVGSFKERQDMEDWLNRWITKYVCADPDASDDVKAQYPLAAAEVVVSEVEGDPGYYSAKFFLRPHYQLEGLTVSLRLVSKLPSAKATN